MKSILSDIANKRIVLCAGPGGVGKTTTSAALALAAAREGRKVCVLTIDPARRLADALGVTLGNDATQVDTSTLHAEGLKVGGELWALMLDPIHTFDDLIERIAPSPAIARRLLDNVIYRQLSRALAGTLEYTAVEKVFDLYKHHDYDLIVVDTPPSKNVLDFLEAPTWLARFFEESVFKWFVLLDPNRPAESFGKGLLKRTGRVVWDVLGRVLGEELVMELAEFMRAIESMAAEFRRRAHGIQDLLASKEAIFYVVATTDPFVMRDARFLCSEIARRGITFGGFVVNRTQSAATISKPDRALEEIRDAANDDPLAERLTHKLSQLLDEHNEVVQQERVAIEKLREDTGWIGFLAMLPTQLEEIHDLLSLHRLSLHFAT